MDSSVIYKSLFIFLILITQVKSIEFNGKFFQG
ncbi:MAG: M23 family peptidase, partial [Proteobacteria bacterium]|nr:M23 family peptidase [Pseudomonadota bacterium]